ncbi:MAG: sulfite exporter TauE/SafE family protein [Methylocystaceae bacterium]
MKKTRITLDINGMTCHNCEKRIAGSLQKTPGVMGAQASYSRSQAVVEYNSEVVTENDIRKVIEAAGYQVASKKGSGLSGIIIAVIALYLLFSKTNVYNFLPQVDQSMTLGIIFIVGLLTSIHCLAMCGGILITQTTREGCGMEQVRVKDRLLPSILYNAGRIISYTVIGGLVGLLGASLSFSPTAKGMIVAISGVLMLIIGINMLGLIPWLRRLPVHLPSFCETSRLAKGRASGRPFIIGLLNGLMPCGPLQAMQLYALGTGSLIGGASAMFIFALGTVPLMFAFGALNSFLTGRFSRTMIKVSSVIVVALGLVMVTRGFAISGFSIIPAPVVAEASTPQVAAVENGVQIVHTIVDEKGYTTDAPVIQKGVPVKWIIEGKSLNGCNNPITLPQMGIEKPLANGENIVEFTPDKDGVLRYSCWMGMVTGSFKVVEDTAAVTDQELKDFAVTNPSQNRGSCCTPQ